MRLVILVLATALGPSIAAAQSEAEQLTAAQLSSVNCAAMARTLAAAARTAEGSERSSTPQPRADSAQAAANSAHVLRSAGIVAALCAHAQRQLTTPAVLPGAAAVASPPDAERTAVVELAGVHRPDEGDEAGHTHEARTPDLAAAPGMRLHAFADVRYSAIDSLGSRNGFALGQFDLFARSQLSENVSVLSELVLTALPKNQFTTRLERLLLTYSPSDLFSASLGRFHTGIGYYNSAYHHGAWFQTAAGRPLIFAAEGDIGIVPIHTLGLSATGELPSGALGLRYLAEVGSGRAGQSSASIAPQPSLTDNNTPSVNLGLIARPDAVDGLQLGVSIYRDRLTMQDTSKAAISETVSAAQAVYKTDLVEVLGEAVVVRHSPRRGQPTHVRGYYGQVSRRFGALRPYARFDHVHAPRANALFGYLGRRSGPTIGIRYDFDALAALKVQSSHLNQTTRSTINRIDAQVAFMF